MMTPIRVPVKVIVRFSGPEVGSMYSPLGLQI